MEYRNRYLQGAVVVTVLTVLFYLVVLSLPQWFCLSMVGLIFVCIALFLWTGVLPLLGFTEQNEYIDDVVDIKYCGKCREPLLVHVDTFDKVSGLPLTVTFICPHRGWSNAHTKETVDIQAELKHQASLEVTQPMESTNP